MVDALEAKLMPPRRLLSIKGLSFSFDNSNSDTPVIHDLHLHLFEGEFVCVMGPSGCGKTSLLRLIAGLLPAPTNSIAFENDEIAKLGYVFQEQRLFYWLNCLKNIQVVANANGNGNVLAANLLKRVGLSGREKDYPRMLSGGQKQRLSLAQVLAKQPKLLLLDEPFSSLDRFSKIEMESLLMGLWEEYRLSVLMVTHDPEEAARLADRILILNKSPANVAEEIFVEVDRPRTRKRSEYIEIVDKIDALMSK